MTSPLVPQRPAGPTRRGLGAGVHVLLDPDGGSVNRQREAELPEELHQRLRRKYRLRADRARIDFYGLCSSCSDPPDSFRARSSND